MKCGKHRPLNLSINGTARIIPAMRTMVCRARKALEHHCHSHPLSRKEASFPGLVQVDASVRMAFLNDELSSVNLLRARSGMLEVDFEKSFQCLVHTYKSELRPGFQRWQLIVLAPEQCVS